MIGRGTRLLVECTAMKKKTETDGDKTGSPTMQSAGLSHSSPETFWSSEFSSYTIVPMKNNERPDSALQRRGYG